MSGLVLLLGAWLELLDRLKKRICKTVGPLLAASLEPFFHRRNVARLRLFCRYYFGRCSSELAQLVAPLPYSRGRSTRYSDRLRDFSVVIPRFYKDVYVNSSFPCTARIWNFLLIGWFPLAYDLCFSLFVLLFLVVNLCLVVAIQPYME